MVFSSKQINTIYDRVHSILWRTPQRCNSCDSRMQKSIILINTNNSAQHISKFEKNFFILFMSSFRYGEMKWNSFSLFCLLFSPQSRQNHSDSMKPTSTSSSSTTRRLKMPLASILQSIRPPPMTGLAEVTVHSCATPPQHRRRIFNRKNLRSPFGHRQNSPSIGNDINSTLSGNYDHSPSP